MRKYFIFLLTLIPLTANGFCMASGYKSIPKIILAHLRTVKGKVIGVNGHTLKLNKGFKDGITTKEFVYIYRNKGHFIPPGTKTPIPLNLGICYGEIISSGPHTSTAKVVSGVISIPKYLLGLDIIPTGHKELIGKPYPGDNFIAGKEQYRIAILTRNPVVFRSIEKTLEETGRFFVINPNIIELNRVKDNLTSLNSKRSITKLSRSLDADVLLRVSISPDLQQLHYRLINGYSGDTILVGKTNLTKQEQLVLKKNSKALSTIPPGNIVASNLSLTPHLSLWERLLGKLGLYSPYSYTSTSSSSFKLLNYINVGYRKAVLSIGRIGHTRYAFVGEGGSVYIYKIGSYSFTKIYAFPSGYTIFHISTLSKNNKIFLAISSYNSYGSLSSSTGAFNGHTFYTIAKNIKFNIRFYRMGNKAFLIGQKASIDSPFYGPVYRLSIYGKKEGVLSLPIHPRSLFEFYRIANYIVYISKYDQLNVYNTLTNKTYSTNGIFNDNVLVFQRYPTIGLTKSHEEETGLKTTVEIPENLYCSVEKKGTYILTKRAYMTNPIVIVGSHYNAYNLLIFRLHGGKLIRIFSSGNVGGNMISFNKTNNKVIGILGVPTSFFAKLLLGHARSYRLTMFKIK